MKRGWRGINSLHTKSNRYTHLSNLGQTEVDNSDWPICSNMWTLGISVGPRIAFRFVRFVQWQEHTSFGLTDFIISVTPIWWQKVTEGWQLILNETEFRIGKSEFTRVWHMAEVVHLGVTEFGISVGPRLLMSVYGSESCWWFRRCITKHLSNQIIIITSSPFNSIGFSYGLNVILDH